MKMDQKILSHLDQLIQDGQDVLSTRRSPDENEIAPDRVDQLSAHQWSTSVQSLLSNIFGSGSVYYVNFTKFVEKTIWYEWAERAQGVLESAKDDYVAGRIFNMRTLVEAELFDEFLDQAEYLLDKGYFQAAAVISGAALENALRQLCMKNNVSLSTNPGINAMNTELYKATIYTKLTYKNIGPLADIRNSAAHGELDQFSENDVKDMLPRIRRFMEDHFV